MPAAPLLPDELERLSMLDALHLLDTPPEPVFDRVTRLASRLLDVPMALFSLVDADRQWFKSRVGLDAQETPRDHAFCAHAIGMSTPLVVNDALADGRFSDNPLVSGPPNIRFYAGVPIRTAAGLAIGTLCVLDTRPRTFSAEEMAALDDLAAILTKEVRDRERLALARDHLERSSAVLGATEARFRTIFDIASVGIALVAPSGAWISVNKAVCDLTGYAEEELLGKSYQQVTHPEDRGGDTQLLQALQRGEIDQYQLEKRYIRKDGSTVWINLNVSPKRNPEGGVDYYVAVMKDIDAQKRAQQEIIALNAGLERRVEERTAELQEANRMLMEAAQRERIAEQELRARDEEVRSVLEYENRHDLLTGLPNRRALQESVPLAQARASRNGKTVGMLFIDLDGFKAVNDSQGHEAGDILLGVIADRLRAGVRKTDSVYRLAGDEFTVLLEDIADTYGDAHMVAEKLISSIAEPVELPGRAVRVRASIGIALDPAGTGNPGRSAEELLKEADHFMYQAKKAGRGRVCSAKHPF